MVGDGHVLVVGLQRLVGAAQDGADGECVPEAGVEVGEDVAEVQPDCVGHASAKCGEAVQRFLPEDVEVALNLWELREATSCCEFFEVHH